MPSLELFIAAYIKTHKSLDARLEKDQEDLMELQKKLLGSKPDLFDIQEDLRIFQSNYDKLRIYFQHTPSDENTYKSYENNYASIKSLIQTTNNLIRSYNVSHPLTNFFDDIYGMSMPYFAVKKELASQTVTTQINYSSFAKKYK